MAAISELRSKFDTMTLAQKKQFCMNLEKSIEGVGNPEHEKFLNECIQKYNAELQASKTSKPTQAAPQATARGAAQTYEQRALFCDKCGKRLTESARFCPFCAAPIGKTQQTSSQIGAPPTYRQYGASAQKSVIQTISGREKLVAVFWLVVAILQAIFAIIYLFAAFVVGEYFISFAVLSVISILNFREVYTGFKFSNRILSDPTGILQRYRNMGTFIGTLIWNLIVLIFAILDSSALFVLVGLLGVAVSIFNIVGLRGYILQNAPELERLEMEYQ